jgi:hypothetical protein
MDDYCAAPAVMTSLADHGACHHLTLSSFFPTFWNAVLLFEVNPARENEVLVVLAATWILLSLRLQFSEVPTRGCISLASSCINSLHCKTWPYIEMQ